MTNVIPISGEDIEIKSIDGPPRYPHHDRVPSRNQSAGSSAAGVPEGFDAVARSRKTWGSANPALLAAPAKGRKIPLQRREAMAKRSGSHARPNPYGPEDATPYVCARWAVRPPWLDAMATG